MKLVIAEKPSVAQTLAQVIGADKRQNGYLEGNGYLVSWCIGHLVSLVPPDGYDSKYSRWNRADLPIIPEKWKWEVSEDKQKQYQILKKLMFRKDVDTIICATDAGREGELIFRLVYNQTGCRKPFDRLWISSMEDQAIADGFANLRDGHDFDRLYQAALCRSKADWLVGMNATRLFTTLYHHRLTVGRVQTPTLAMLVKRHQQIENFQKQKYFNVHIQADGLDAVKEKISDSKTAEMLQRNCDGQSATVTSIIRTEKTVNPPRLYDLTTLQREANRHFGYTAAKTLEFTQSLYEKSLVTYPRTDSQFLTDDMEETVQKMVHLVCRDLGLPDISTSESDISRVLNSHKVSDHTAVIPTGKLCNADKKTLSKGEQDILLLIEFRLLCATGRRHRYQETSVTVSCAGESFKTRGKQVIEEGWKVYDNYLKLRFLNDRTSDKGKEKTPDEPGHTEEPTLPALEEGQILTPVQSRVSEHFTSPPKAFTEDLLLSSMETAGNESFDKDTEKKGLGTPATRAAIIEKLILSGYVMRKGKQLIPTKDGIQLIKVLPDLIKSPMLTAEWENTLKRMEKGEADPETFMTGIRNMVEEMVLGDYSLTKEDQKRFGDDRSQREQIGICPRCGSPVYEGARSFYCSDRNRSCMFCIWKESNWLSKYHVTVSKNMARDFLKQGRTRNVTFYSEKKRKHFKADLIMRDTGKYINYQMEFPEKENRG